VELLLMNTIDHLLLPIREDQPAGIDLRTQMGTNSLYQKLKDARLAARTIERQQSQEYSEGTDMRMASAQWKTVLTLGAEVLINHSKDLDIAAWMTEALLRENNFAGLAQGFILLRELIERFWDDLYPSIDEEGLLTKLAPLTGLNGDETEGTLIIPIALISLTEGRTAGPFALWQYQSKSLNGIQTAVKETSPLFFHQLRQDLLHCQQAFTQLTSVLDKRCGADAPPASRIRMQLAACLECVESITKDIPGHIPVAAATADVSVSVVPVLQETPREQMLQQLLQAAEFFRRTEPHSPLSYLLERTVRWGRMSLPELLKEIIPDEQARGQMGNLTGVDF
jgi:type VI secretion system protein ImpA